MGFIGLTLTLVLVLMADCLLESYSLSVVSSKESYEQGGIRIWSQNEPVLMKIRKTYPYIPLGKQPHGRALAL